MKVLWFEVTPPSRYLDGGLVIGGWQDSLERIARTIPDIELYIAFESNKELSEKNIDGVHYVPICPNYTKSEAYSLRYSWEANAQKLIESSIPLIENIHPDIIHIFGTEWPWGLIAEKTTIPVVIHMQGSIVFYNNAMYPPRYSFLDDIKRNGIRHPKRIRNAFFRYHKDLSREAMENRIWKVVNNYMGRTCWDKAMTNLMHPNCNYFHVEEALRDGFVIPKKTWSLSKNKKIQLISTGCGTFWKGPDMLLKTARCLKDVGFEFEWIVAGGMNENVKEMVEYKENTKFSDCNVNFIGYVQSHDLIELLLSSTLYVHNSYVENSPNSICEAQCLGVPVISTNVGGIASLVENNEDGILVPANDPWQMAYAIIELAKDEKKMKTFSTRSMEKAHSRHNPENIKNQLLQCYNAIITKES